MQRTQPEDARAEDMRCAAGHGKGNQMPELSPAQWGIALRNGLWPVTIRILFVIDGRIILTKGAQEFGLGYVLDALRAAWAWWVTFEVDIVSREEKMSHDARGSNDVKFLNFRFTQSDFDIHRYDQIWFFGDQPNATDGSDATNDTHIVPPYTLEDAELAIIAGWMDRGGGVFATGDHGVLGASMCSRIPRVRTMRRWKRSDGVPSLNGQRRHQTLQGGSDYLGEGDTQLQPVELVYWATAHKPPFLPQYRPHPVMCSPWGLIDRFPDHMHEGELVPDGLVELDRPLGIPGHEAPEYPFPIPEFIAAGLTDVGTLRWRPRPQIIAFGQTTNRYQPEYMAFGMAGPMASGPHLITKRFGLVSAYDGHPAKVGRVVCDSTWHHWLSENLTGIATGDLSAYRKMQAYYRNIGLWLSGQTRQRSMVVSAAWGALIGSWPGFFTADQDAWDMGDRALHLFGPTMSPCWSDEVVASFLDFRARSLRNLSGDLSSAPDWGGLSVELVNRAVVGSVCKALFDTAFEHRRVLQYEDSVTVDTARVHELGLRGAARGIELLRETLTEAATSLARLRDALTYSRDTTPEQGEPY